MPGSDSSQTDHICTVCFRSSVEHRCTCDHCEYHHYPALCCPGCGCGSFEDAHMTFDPDKYYAWHRQTNEYLGSVGWTESLPEAFGFATREFAWKSLEKACRRRGLDQEYACVSIGHDLVEELPPDHPHHKPAGGA